VVKYLCVVSPSGGAKNPEHASARHDDDVIYRQTRENISKACSNNIIFKMALLASIIGTLLRATDVTSSPFLSNLAPAVLAAFSVQLLFGVPGVRKQSDFLYDLSGGLTFALVLFLSFLLPALRREGDAAVSIVSVLDGTMWNWRQVVFTAYVLLWAVRCESFFILFPSLSS
jgi:hypothetical protein